MHTHNSSTVSSYYQFHSVSQFRISMLQIFSLFIIFTSIRGCDFSIAIDQKVYINHNNYCQVSYCTQSQMSTCYYYSCQNTDQKCKLVRRFLFDKACSRSCCRGIAANQNKMNFVSQKYCQNYANSVQSSSFVGVLIMAFIFVIVAAFLVAIIVTIFRSCNCFRNLFGRASSNTNQPNRANSGNSSLGTNQHISEQNQITSTLAEEGPNFIDISNQCVICLDSKVNLRTHCNHYYHAKCLYEWIKKKPGNPCPLCMSSIYNPVKVYCKHCLIGQMLINFTLKMNENSIKQIDGTTCKICKEKSLTSSQAKSSRGKFQKDGVSRIKIKKAKKYYQEGLREVDRQKSKKYKQQMQSQR